MPHISDTPELPTSPKRPQGVVPRSQATRQPKTDGDAQKKAKLGMLPALSMHEYKVDSDLIEEALGTIPETQDRVDMRFEQPKFGR